MKKVLILPSFERSVKRLSPQEKSWLAERLEAFNSFLISGSAPYGFRFKKIHHDKYEFRINIRLRVVVKAEADSYYLVLAGEHDEVRRYLKNFK